MNLAAALDRCPRPWQPQPVERRPTLSLNEWAVLGLLVERPRHGYDIATELRPGTPVGEVWRLSRQLVYRALERLEALGLVEPRRTEHGTGPPRTVYGPTRRGRDALRRVARHAGRPPARRSQRLPPEARAPRAARARTRGPRRRPARGLRGPVRPAGCHALHRQRRDPVAPPLSGRGGLVPRRCSRRRPAAPGDAWTSVRRPRAPLRSPRGHGHPPGPREPGCHAAGADS